MKYVEPKVFLIAETILHAKEEIRRVFDQIADTLASRYPAIYQDMERSDDGEYSFQHGRI